MKKKNKSNVPDLLSYMTVGGLLGLALLNRNKPFFLYEQIAEMKGIPLWSTPEMNLQSYYSPTKEAPIPVYSGGEIILFATKIEDE